MQTERLNALSRGWREILPSDVRFEIAQASDYTSKLSVLENEAIRNARKQRAEEFSTGRHLLKKILSKMNVSFGDLTVTPNGSVKTGSSVTCSISHSGGFVFAAAAPASSFQSIGADMEVLEDINPEDIEGYIPQTEFRQIISDLSLPRAAVSFSLRESIAKCFGNFERRFIDFAEVLIDYKNNGAVEILPISDYMQKKFLRDSHRSFYYDYIVNEDFILTFFCINFH
ncbi:hypothetical protein [Sedimentisphaera salicampi]|uniref:4'-phosphopantetheinyl transferase N-terminal domain-containing protein n=1 Tax=Sedimentisphaera salicampi TaxID=1941349 RepID=A0A1W6LJE3_9BACT|nr:hypothetical protein [Sedimentisphaera salicampi]ARN55863.1 hypothetical protein STSP1_00229 [Sedimentisphaera salicampi]